MYMGELMVSVAQWSTYNAQIITGQQQSLVASRRLL